MNTMLALAIVLPTQCPTWDGSFGSPGASSGYVQPFAVWDDGNGEAIFAGGSFANIGGAGAQLLGRLDPLTGTWSRPGGGLDRGSTNGFLTDMEPFDDGNGERLVVAGVFADAANVLDTRSLAAWDGTNWHSLGAQLIPGNAVWALHEADVGEGNRLYIAGSFPTLGGTTVNGIGSWDGTTYAPVGSGAGVTGSFSPFISDMVSWDDGTGEALYAVGRFDSIDGETTRLVAKFDGEAWSRLGLGLTTTSVTTTLDTIEIFDDGTGEALYIGGSSFRVLGLNGTWSVARWDGTDWTGIGQDLGGRTTSLKGWDDGQDGLMLYAAGTAQPGINYFARLENNQWVTAFSGITGPAIPPSNFPSVFGLGTWNGNLLIGGNFTMVGGGTSADGVAMLAPCACAADWNNDGIVNTSDLLDYINDYNAVRFGGSFTFGDPDLAAPLGVLNTADFLAFLNIYNAGC